MKNQISIINNLRSLFFFALKGWDNIFKINNNRLTILAYHAISDSEDLYSIDFTRFKNQIDKLKKQSKFVGIDEVIKTIDGEEVKGSKIVLTFDDGYENILSVSAYLKKNRIPAALFVLSNPSNTSTKELGNDHKFLSVNQIKNLKKQGWTIGCHSATHANFSKLSKKQLENEIVSSKKTLEKKLGFKINYFAYPKGVFDTKIINLVKKAGYEAAFATTPGSIKKGISRFVIPRTVINKSYQISDFPQMLSESNFFLRNVLKRPLNKLYQEK